MLPLASYADLTERRSTLSESTRMANAMARKRGLTISRTIDPTARSKVRLSSSRGSRETEPADAEHRHSVDVVELDRGADDLEHPRQYADSHPDRLRDANQVDDVPGICRGRRDDDAMNIQLAYDITHDLRDGDPIGSRDFVAGEWKRRDHLRPSQTGGQLVANPSRLGHFADHETALEWRGASGHRARDHPPAHDCGEGCNPQRRDPRRAETAREQDPTEGSRDPKRTAR